MATGIWLGRCNKFVHWTDTLWERRQFQGTTSSYKQQINLLIPINAEPFETTPMGDTGLRFKSFKAVQWTVQFVLGVLLLWWIVTSANLSGKELAQVLAQASLFPLTLAVFCFAISMIMKALQYRILLPPATSNVYLTGVALSQTALLTFLPWRIGEVSFPLLLRKDYNIPLTSSMSLLLVIRLVDLLIAVTVALVGSRKIGLSIHWMAIIFGIAVAVALFFVLNFIGRRVRTPSSLRSIIVAVDQHCSVFRFGNLLLLSIGIFITTTLQSTFALRAMGLAVTLPDIAFLNAVSLLAAILPIHPPGGWGTIDSIQIALLQNLHYDPGVSVPVILATHCFYTLLIIGGGVIGWLLRGRTCFR
jgi:uncharacterized membrane protein YbhN (UPF0104 family)